MRILYLTQWFEPEPAFKGIDFARALADRGHQVEIATGYPNYPGGKVYPGHRIRPWRRETMLGLKVHRLWLWPAHDRSAIGRILNYVSFWLSCLIFGLLRGRRYDAVHVYHPPITPALAAALFCAVWQRPFIVEIQDLWPDSVASSGLASTRVVRILNGLCRFTYRRAAAVVAQSEGMRARLAARGVPEAKLWCIRNWSTYTPAADDSDRAPDLVRQAFAGRLNVVYGGNMGQAQQLDVLIDAAAAATINVPTVHLHLFGSGIDRNRLVAHIEAIGAADRITMHGPVSRQVMDRIFDLADVVALHLRDDPLYEVTIPSKAQHYLSCGKPIIAGLSGEAAEMLGQSGAAIVTAPGDHAAMADAIVSLARMSAGDRAALGNCGREYYEINLAFQPAVDRTLAILDRVVSGDLR